MINILFIMKVIFKILISINYRSKMSKAKGEERARPQAEAGLFIAIYIKLEWVTDRLTD